MCNSVFQIQWPVFRLSTHLPLCIHTQSSHYNQILALSFSECQEDEAPWDVFRLNNLFNLSSVLNYKEVRDCRSTTASCHCQIIDHSNQLGVFRLNGRGFSSCLKYLLNNT